MARTRRRSKVWVATLVVSLLLHLALVPGLYTLLIVDPQPNPSQANQGVPQRAVHLLSQKQLQKLTSGKQRIKPVQPSPGPAPKPKVKTPDGQVVDVPDRANATPPEKARFLSEVDNSVEREQVSAKKDVPSRKMVKSDRRVISPGEDIQGQRDGKARRARSEQSSPRPRRPKPGDSDRKGKKVADRQGKKAKAPGKSVSSKLPQGEGRFRPQAEGGENVAAQQRGGDTPGGASAPDSWTSLLPTLGPRDAVASSGSIDHIEGVDEGDQTFLNTREYRYAFFFNRVKKNVRERWRAAQVHRRHDPHGRIFGVRDRLTVVQVTLNPHGDLDDVIITKDSGIAFLDEAAIDAFRAAQPFPNPPDGLQDSDGHIRFRFGFFLEINSGGFRLFRSR